MTRAALIALTLALTLLAPVGEALALTQPEMVKLLEEIDERHLVLQQELIRHVHDLVTRIEFVFESAETNHLYIDGLVRETREELGKLDQKLAALASTGDDGA